MRIVKLRSYVEFIYPFEKPSEREIETRDPTGISAPNESMGFRFFDRTEYVDDDGKNVIGQPNKYSGIHFFGEVLTLKDARKRFPDDRKLKNMMLCDERDNVVLTDLSHFYLFRKDDLIVQRNNK